MTFEDSGKSIFSPVLEDGHSLSGLPVGTTTDLSGQDHAPVSHSPKRASNRRRQTNDISGLKCSGLFESVSLTQSLANRLRARFDTVGSMEYVQTWKERVTPLGRSYSEHTARGVLISDKDFTGWPTPQATEAPNNSENRGMDYGGLRSRLTPQNVPDLVGWISPKTPTGGASASEPRANGGQYHKLEDQVALTGWPTPTSMSFDQSHQPGNNRYMNAVTELAGWVSPTAQDHNRGNQPPRSTDTGIPLTQQVAQIDDSSMSGWNTPRATDGTNGGPNQSGGSLPADAATAGWASPSSRDWKETPGMSQEGVNPDGSTRERMDQLPRQVHGLTSESSTAPTANRGVLNHLFSAWLMAFPIEHEIPSWFTCAPNFQSWVTVQKILSELSLKPSGIESEA
jgi:hypothetical protein